MRTYDMQEEEWRGKFEERGETWRSERAYRCEICHTKTNKWVMGGWPCKGPRLLCPGDEYEEHDELESVLQRYDEVQNLFNICNSVDRERAEEMRELPLLGLLEEKIEELRGKFTKEVNDVKEVARKMERLQDIFYDGFERELSLGN